MAPLFAQERSEGVELAVWVQPGASRSRVVGVHDGRLKIQLAAPPVDGAANEALTALLADLLGLPRKAVRLVGGETSRRKRILIFGVTGAQLAALLPPP